MKHLKKSRKFGRKIGQRKALLKGLLGNVLVREDIKTTEAKAKELKTILDVFISKTKKLLTENKSDGIHILRELKSQIPQNITKKRLEDIASRFATRNGGYSKIVKISPRKSDSARMARIMILKK